MIDDRQWCKMRERRWEGLRDLEKLLVDLLKGVDALLELDVVGREFGLRW